MNERKAAWVFRYFLDRSHGHNGKGDYYSYQLAATTTYDDGLDFAVAFGIAFPGRLHDPNHIHASRRLSALLRNLCDVGQMERGRLGNQSDGAYGCPKWQYEYRLTQGLINVLKTGLITPEQAAEAFTR